MTPGLSLAALLLWILATPVQFYFGMRFYVGAYKVLIQGHANMDVLVAIGTSAAYLYSVVSVCTSIADGTVGGDHGAHFFETSAMLISFILLGKFLESYAKGKTCEAISALVNLAPPVALLCEDGPGTEEKGIEVELLRVGDCLRILPGTKVIDLWASYNSNPDPNSELNFGWRCRRTGSLFRETLAAMRP